MAASAPQPLGIGIPVAAWARLAAGPRGAYGEGMAIRLLSDPRGRPPRILDLNGTRVSIAYDVVGHSIRASVTAKFTLSADDRAEVEEWIRSDWKQPQDIQFRHDVGLV